jgi:hypothetical protein
MAFEITSDTVVKIVVRRGEEPDRKQTLLSNGELGFSQDIGRLFIGDGFTLGGRPVSNIFHGFANDYNDFTSIAQPGDTIYQTADNTLYALDGDQWRQASPQFGGSFLQYQNPDAKWFLDPAIFNPAFTYSPIEPDLNSLGRFTNRIDLNRNFWSLSAQPTYGSFYLGDWDLKTVTNNLDATLNVSNKLFVHNEEPNPYQLQIIARSATDGGISTIKSTRGGLNLKGVDRIDLYSDSFKHVEIWNGSYVRINNQITGTYSVPNFDVHGYSRFRDSVDIDEDLTITGNLSVYGEMSYFETFVTTTSAITALNRNLTFTGPVLQVSQLAATDNQIIARFDGHSSDVESGRPVMTVWDGPFVGINTPMSQNRNNTTHASFVVSGGAAFGYTRNGDEGFWVYAGSKGVTLNSYNGGLASTVSTSMTFNAVDAFTADASHFILDSSSDNTYAGLKVVNNRPGTSKIGIDVRSSDSGRGLWVVPDSAAAAYNGLVQANDTAIIATAGAEDQGDLVLGIWSAGTKGIRIDQNGDVSVNTASNPSGYKLNVSGTGNFSSTLRSGGAFTVASGGASIAGGLAVTSGNITCTQDIIAYSTSDKRLKINIAPISSPLDKLDQITGIEFDWDTAKQSDYTGHDVGVIAQEIEEIIPEAVITRENGYKAVKYEKIIPLLIEAIKELKERIQ